MESGQKEQLVYRGIHVKSLDAPCVVKYDAPPLQKIPVRVFVRLKLARGCAVAAENFSMVGCEKRDK